MSFLQNNAISEIETAYLVVQLVILLRANFPLISIKELRAQTMNSLAFIELAIQSASISFISVPMYLKRKCSPNYTHSRSLIITVPFWVK
jgi:hypothetical protein